MKHKSIGENFDSFLEEEGILEPVEKVAIKSYPVIGLDVPMKSPAGMISFLELIRINSRKTQK